MKVMIIDLDSERGRISLSTKALEPEPGDMLTDPQKVFSKAWCLCLCCAIVW